MYKFKFLFGFILFVMLLFNYKITYGEETLILGPGDGVLGGPTSDNLHSNGQDAEDTWKAFRWQAGKSGTADYFGLAIQSIPNPSSVTNVNLQFAVWEDRGVSKMGNLKVWGYALNYNFTTLGVTRHIFPLNKVITNRNIVAGNFYWIGFRSNIGNNGTMYFERATTSDPIPTNVDGIGVCDYTSGPNGCMKKGCRFSSPLPPMSSQPPNGNSGTNCFADGTGGYAYAANYYGWTVWGGDTGELYCDSNPCVGLGECNSVCNEEDNNCFDPYGTPCTDDGNSNTKDICTLGQCVHIPNTFGCSVGDCLRPPTSLSCTPTI